MSEEINTSRKYTIFLIAFFYNYYELSLLNKSVISITYLLKKLQKIIEL